MSEIKAGDVVQLKSNTGMQRKHAPLMTVGRVLEGDCVKVYWWDIDHCDIEEKVLPVAALEVCARK